MDTAKSLRNEVKKYIDTADDKVVKMVHTILEVDADAGWWDEMPDGVRADVEEAMRQADRGEVMSHVDVKKKYSKYFDEFS